MTNRRLRLTSACLFACLTAALAVGSSQALAAAPTAPFMTLSASQAKPTGPGTYALTLEQGETTKDVSLGLYSGRDARDSSPDSVPPSGWTADWTVAPAAKIEATVQGTAVGDFTCTGASCAQSGTPFRYSEFKLGLKLAKLYKGDGATLTVNLRHDGIVRVTAVLTIAGGTILPQVTELDGPYIFTCTRGTCKFKSKGGTLKRDTFGVTIFNTRVVGVFGSDRVPVSFQLERCTATCRRVRGGSSPRKGIFARISLRDIFGRYKPPKGRYRLGAKTAEQAKFRYSRRFTVN